MHIISQVPDFHWLYFDGEERVQDSFEIAVGTDDEWDYAEMWNPSPFESEDTSVVYAGAPLIDGEIYWLRLRVHNSLYWSEWAELSFRMNSIPSVPFQVSPINDEIVPSLNPDLTIDNSFDSENDSIIYTFEVSVDSLDLVYYFTKKPDPGLTTTLTVDSTLEENFRHWWRVKASDYYEESEYSEFSTFFVNSENTAPSAFNLILPPDTSGAPVAILTPEFFWSYSLDPDPIDSIAYELWIAIDSQFTFVHIVPDIYHTSHVLTDSLSWGTTYWWKVRADDQNGASTWSNQVLSFRTVVPGDADASGEVDIDDAVYLINYIFSGGSAPKPPCAGDADCSAGIDIDDVVYLIEYIFSGGPEPCAGC